MTSFPCFLVVPLVSFEVIGIGPGVSAAGIFSCENDIFIKFNFNHRCSIESATAANAVPSRYFPTGIVDHPSFTCTRSMYKIYAEGDIAKTVLAALLTFILIAALLLLPLAPSEAV